MAFKLPSDVSELSSTAGTGAQTLAGAVSSYFTFAAKFSNGDTFLYSIRHLSAAEREIGVGTYNAGANTVSRTTVIKSTNADAAVNFSAGSKVISVVQIGPSDLSVQQAMDVLSLMGAVAKGNIFGLTLSNNGSDATNDIDIAAGEAVSTETTPAVKRPNCAR